MLFKYETCKSVHIDSLFCLLSTTVIASYKGYRADLVKTELEPLHGLVPQFYRAYYEMVAGEYNKDLKTTVNGMTINIYNTKFYDNVKRNYDAVNGVDSFNTLTSAMQFEEVFRRALLPTVGKSLSQSLISHGHSKEEVEENYKAFVREFVMDFRFNIDEFMVLYSTPAQLWVALSNFAIDMPHVVIGLRKQLSAYNHQFFMENKDNLGSIGTFLKSKNLKFTRYTSTLSIAGIIINAFTQYHYIDRWMGEYGSIISSGSSMVVGDDGVILYGSETQEKMYSNSQSFGIDNFEIYMRAIDEGSELYNIKNDRYFNLIEWRQNKIKLDMIESLSKLPIASKLSVLGLKIGGGLTPDDISNAFGNANGDKRIKFETLDEMISEVYNSNVDSTIASNLIDNWIAIGERKNRQGDAINGRYPMNFKFKEGSEKFYSYNKNQFKKLIRGVNALKSLESAIKQMDYTFMSFPVYGYSNNPHELIKGVSLYDYLNQIKALDTSIQIESDINSDVALEGTILIDNISGKSTEVMRTIARENIVNKISLGSLADEELALTIDKESDREILRLLKERGFNIQITKENKGNSIKDIMFENITKTLTDARAKCQLSQKSTALLFSKLCKNETDDTTGLFVGKIRHLTMAIVLFAIYGKLIHDSSKNSKQNQDSYRIDNRECLSLDMAESYDYIKGYNDVFYERVFRRHFTEDELNIERNSLFYKSWLGYKFYNSPMWNKNLFNSVPYVFIDSSTKQEVPLSYVVKYFVPIARKIDSNSNKSYVDLTDSICRTVTDTTKNIAETKFDVNDYYYLPRAICFCLNVHTIIEYIFAAVNCLEENIPLITSSKVNTNDSSTVNIRLVIKNLRAIESLNTSSTVSDVCSTLKLYQDIYEGLFSVIPSSKKFPKDTSDKGIYRFVFMDSIQVLSGNIDDLTEDLFQYREVTKLAQVLISHTEMYNIRFGDANHSISEFLSLVSDILTLDKKQADKEYFTDSIAMSTINDKTQRDIANKIQLLVDSDPDSFMYDDSETWLTNIKEYCANNKIDIPKNIENSIHLNYERYSVNQYGLITIDNKVVHSHIHTPNGTDIVVLSRYGIFVYDNDRVIKCRNMRNLRWLLH